MEYGENVGGRHAPVRMAHMSPVTGEPGRLGPVTSSDRRSTVAAVSKAAEILRLLGSRPGGTSSTIARDLGLDRTTVHRLLTTLAESDLVHRAGSRWWLGTAAAALGGAYVDQSRLRQVALPYAIDLQRTLLQRRGVLSIDVWAGTEMLVLERVWNRRTPLPMILNVGSRVRVASTASGLAVLARLPDEQVTALLGEVEASTASAIERARRQGGLATVPRGVLPGLSAMASAITDGAGRPVGTLVIAGIDIWQHDATSDMARSLQAATRKASSELAGSGRAGRPAAQPPGLALDSVGGPIVDVAPPGDDALAGWAGDDPPPELGSE